MTFFDFHHECSDYQLRFRYVGKSFKPALRLENERGAERMCDVRSVAIS